MVKLTKGQKQAINLLANSPLKEKFYLTGGTLLAFLYLQHRYSLDIDFFSEQKFTFAEINQFMETLKQKGRFKKVETKKIFDRWEFLLKNGETLRIEFVYYNQEKKTLRKRKRLFGVYIDSLEDISANKTLAYFDRNEPKDLFDIYFLIKKGGLSPKKLLKLAHQKFGVELSEEMFWSEAFKGLPVLKSIKPLMIEGSEKEKNLLLKNIEDYFKANSAKYLRRVIR